MHRAFDRGLLSIDENYRILVSEHLTEDQNHPDLSFTLRYPLITFNPQLVTYKTPTTKPLPSAGSLGLA